MFDAYVSNIQIAELISIARSPLKFLLPMPALKYEYFILFSLSTVYAGQLCMQTLDSSCYEDMMMRD